MIINFIENVNNIFKISIFFLRINAFSSKYFPVHLQNRTLFVVVLGQAKIVALVCCVLKLQPKIDKCDTRSKYGKIFVAVIQFVYNIEEY